VSRTLALSREAEEDLLEASAWYQEQREGLGIEFLAATDEMFRRIEERPLLYEEIAHSVRRALVRRFPYSVYFQITGGGLYVVGVLAQRSSPSVWRFRTRSQ
jgi:hypothetical protein